MICQTVARSASPEPPPPTAAAAAAEIWGTWEDLLLACAVSRLGSKTWDSVASEVRSRSPAAAAAALLTPDACRRRYRHLQSQFSSSADAAAAASGVGEVPWLEELRKLRVAELRREVQRYDVSIGSLQLKVKRLKEEERERTLGGAAANGEKGPDLKAEEDRKGLRSPGSDPADRISAGDSGRSCKESNSTDPKARGGDGQQPPREATDDPCPCRQPPVPAAAAEEKSVGESSYNGSSDTIARGAAAGRSPVTESGPAPPQEVGESGESFAESKGVEAESRNSDVQSSAGLPRRRRGRRRKAVLGRPGGGGEEKEKEPDANSVRAPEESQPLLVFLEIIRSHKCGFVFESRLKSQDGDVYNGLVKQHVDLEMVRARIMGGGYTRLEFFRDLLLICNNAIVYYPKASPEFSAAVKLRQLVNNEISATSRDFPARPLPSPPPPMPMPQLEASKEATKKEATPPPDQPPAAPLPPPAAPKPKPEPDLVRSSKPGPLPPPLIACKKRSSITTKPPAAMSRKEERDAKKEADPVKEEEENGVAKEKVKERRTAVSGTRGPRTNKTRGSKGGGGGGEMAKSMANRKLEPAEEEIDAPEPVALTKAEKEKKTAGGAAAVAKKRSAAIFLDRLNRAPPKTKGGAAASKGELMETLKATGNGNGGAEQKKGGDQQRKGGGGRKEQATRQSTSAAAKQAAAAEQSAAPVKRSVGRPPKRAPPLSPPVKRAREEKAAPQPSRKRARR